MCYPLVLSPLPEWEGVVAYPCELLNDMFRFTLALLDGIDMARESQRRVITDGGVGLSLYSVLVERLL